MNYKQLTAKDITVGIKLWIVEKEAIQYYGFVNGIRYEYMINYKDSGKKNRNYILTVVNSFGGALEHTVAENEIFFDSEYSAKIFLLEVLKNSIKKYEERIIELESSIIEEL